MTLADRMEVVLLERGPLPACELATAVCRRKAVVSAELRRDPRFVQWGRRRASRWGVIERPTFDVGWFPRRDPSWRTRRELAARMYVSTTTIRRMVADGMPSETWVA